MLRKRSRPYQKDPPVMVMGDHLASDSFVVHKSRVSPFFTLPGLFYGFKPKAIDSDSAKSPTSPLDYKQLFSNLQGNCSVTSPRSPRSKIWDSKRVGLGLADSFNDETQPCVLIGSQMRIHTPPNPKTHLDYSIIRDDHHLFVTSPESLPKNYGISSQTHIDSPKFAIGSSSNTSLADIRPPSISRNQLMQSNSEVFELGVKDTQLGSSSFAANLSGSLPVTIGNGNAFMGSLSASEIELSEDYTCIISHGPNPKTTHIFGDCVLDSHTVQCLDYKNNKDKDTPFHSDDFLSYCFSCKKKLEQGEDIYIYRGEKAFCSCNCRDKEILFEEEMEKPTSDCSAECLGSSFHEERFISGNLH